MHLKTDSTVCEKCQSISTSLVALQVPYCYEFGCVRGWKRRFEEFSSSHAVVTSFMNTLRLLEIVCAQTIEFLQQHF